MKDEMIIKLMKALDETAECLDDVGAGRGGWAWEEVVADARAVLEEAKEDGVCK